MTPLGATGLITLISTQLSNVQRLQKQLSREEAQSLLTDYRQADVIDILERMDNYRDLPRKYTSVYRTCRNWLEADIKAGKRKPAKKEALHKHPLQEVPPTPADSKLASKEDLVKATQSLDPRIKERLGL